MLVIPVDGPAHAPIAEPRARSHSTGPKMWTRGPIRKTSLN